MLQQRYHLPTFKSLDMFTPSQMTISGADTARISEVSRTPGQLLNANEIDVVPQVPYYGNSTKDTYLMFNLGLGDPSQLSSQFQGHLPFLGNSIEPPPIQHVNPEENVWQGGLHELVESDYHINGYQVVPNYYSISNQSASPQFQYLTASPVIDPQGNSTELSTCHQYLAPTDNVKSVLKKKRSRISLEEKIEIIDFQKANPMSMTQLARYLKRPRTTIIGILKRKNEIRNKMELKIALLTKLRQSKS
ncbi:hypothetical protein BGZ76_009980 [Entomortierella beljakovae]|nr:hypothetical protein BGZ76_009980 [Entomortierella beljakovae]